MMFTYTFTFPKIYKLLNELSVQNNTISNIDVFNSKVNQELRDKLSYDDFKLIYEGLINLLNENWIQKILNITGEICFKKKSDNTVGKIEGNIIYTELPRTVRIYTNDDNSFSCIIETKSKLADGTKADKSKNPRGASKSCKPSYLANPPVAKDNEKQIIVGDNETQKVSLSMKCPRDEYVVDALKEAEVSRMTDAGVNMYTMLHQRKIKKVIHFGDKGIELSKLLNNNYDKLNQNDKIGIFKSIVNELVILHRSGIIHQDIKPENIIVFKGPDNKYKAKLHDFGLCNKITNTARATAGYESYEMEHFNFCSLVYNCNSNRFRTLATILLAKHNRKKSVDRKLLTPAKYNDLWALGVLYLKLMYVPKMNAAYIDNVSSDIILEKCNSDPIANILISLKISRQDNVLEKVLEECEKYMHKETEENNFDISSDENYFEPPTEANKLEYLFASSNAFNGFSPKI